MNPVLPQLPLHQFFPFRSCWTQGKLNATLSRCNILFKVGNWTINVLHLFAVFLLNLSIFFLCKSTFILKIHTHMLIDASGATLGLACCAGILWYASENQPTPPPEADYQLSSNWLPVANEGMIARGWGFGAHSHRWKSLCIFFYIIKIQVDKTVWNGVFHVCSLNFWFTLTSLSQTWAGTEHLTENKRKPGKSVLSLIQLYEDDQNDRPTGKENCSSK